MTTDNQGFYNGKTTLKKAHKGLMVCFVLFFCSLITGFLGLKLLSQILFYMIIPVFAYTWINGAKVVIRGNKKAYQRLKNGQTILTEDLLDDESK